MLNLCFCAMHIGPLGGERRPGKRTKIPLQPYLHTLSIRRALPAPYPRRAPRPPDPRRRHPAESASAAPPSAPPPVHDTEATAGHVEGPRRGMTGGGAGRGRRRAGHVLSSARRSSKPPERGPCPARSRWRGGAPATGAADLRIREREVGGPPAEPAPPWPPRGRTRAVPRCRPGFADTSSAARWKGLSRRHGLRRRHSRAPPGTRGAAAAGILELRRGRRVRGL